MKSNDECNFQEQEAHFIALSCLEASGGRSIRPLQIKAQKYYQQYVLNRIKNKSIHAARWSLANIIYDYIIGIILCNQHVSIVM